MRLERSVAAAEYLEPRPLPHYKFTRTWSSPWLRLRDRDYALAPGYSMAARRALFLASRDTLAKFYERSGRLLAAPAAATATPETTTTFE